MILDLTPCTLDPEGFIAALAGDRRRVPIVVLAGQESDGPSVMGEQLGVSIVECFASARTEAHVLERIERVRDDLAQCDRELS